MTYQGIIRFFHELEGTKSEGDYAYLVLDENTRHRLYRAGDLAADSEFLRPYADQEVSIEGEMENNESICINSVNNEPV